jgi:hypothetical protein
MNAGRDWPKLSHPIAMPPPNRGIGRQNEFAAVAMYGTH